MRVTINRGVSAKASLVNHYQVGGSINVFRADITSRVGGGAASLNSIATASLPIPYLIKILKDGTSTEEWLLKIDSGTPADNEVVVEPLDYNSTSNPRKWFRVL